MHDRVTATANTTAGFSGRESESSAVPRCHGKSSIVFTLFLFVALAFFSTDVRAEDRKNVLLLNSYHHGFAWTDDITRGIITALKPVRGETRIYIEYMNTKWVKHDRYFEEFSRLLRMKYSNTRFDLILCSDTDAFDFLVVRRDELFGRVPTVFCGVNNFRPEDLRGRRLFTGVSETADPRETFELALKLFPRTKRFLVINDSGIAGKKVREEIDRLLPKYRGKVEFIFENKTDLEDIVRDVSALPGDSLVFYTFFYGDPTSKYYENTECISRISKSSKVPVFGAWDFNLGHGILGGKLISGYDQGLAAGSMGLRILRGEPVARLPVVYETPLRFMFDYRQMQKFNLEGKNLPRDSVVLNEPDPFHKVRKEVVWAAFAAIAGLGFIVFILVLNVDRRRKAERLLKISHEGLEKRVEERTRDLTELNQRISEVNLRLAEMNEELSEDIKRRLRAEDELDRSRKILNKILEANPDVLIVFDREMRTVHSNCGAMPEDITEEMGLRRGEGPETLCAAPGIISDSSTVMDVFRTGKPFQAERFNERTGCLEIRAVPVFDDNGQVFMVAVHIRDVTARKKMEQEILKAQKLESLGVLAGGIAHDFNNLLTGIMGNISLAKMYAEPESKAHVRLDEAEKGCDRASALTKRLLTFSKGGAPVRKSTSISKVLTDSAGFVLRGAGIKVGFSLPDNLWNVDIDEGLMSQVAGNLFRNADEAMPDGGAISVTGENIEVIESDSLPLVKGRYIRVSISDQGSGISKADLPFIFDPYFTTKEKGSGLGLATVYSIMKQHQGHLSVETAAGAGTVFHLYLPASFQPAGMEGGREESPAPGPLPKRLLVMDDEEMIREIAREILTHLGHDVDVCRDGESALALYRDARRQGRPYAAVIMDLTIPGRMGGKDLMSEILKIDPRAKGIVSTGYSDDPILASFRDYGFCAFVAKPYTPAELKDALLKLD
jgi:signal transduction histidine kinase/CheY-like chemotaxis protein/ABC-type uncharacterized transport system substrate-binding protein